MIIDFPLKCELVCALKYGLKPYNFKAFSVEEVRYLSLLSL